MELKTYKFASIQWEKLFKFSVGEAFNFCYFFLSSQFLFLFPILPSSRFFDKYIKQVRKKVGQNVSWHVYSCLGSYRCIFKGCRLKESISKINSAPTFYFLHPKLTASKLQFPHQNQFQSTVNGSERMLSLKASAVFQHERNRE